MDNILFKIRISILTICLLAGSSAPAQMTVFDPAAAGNAAKSFAEMVNANANNYAFSAENLKFLADGSLKLGDMVGKLNDLNNFYKKLNPYLQSAVMIQKVIKGYIDITNNATDLLKQAASSNFINASQRNIVVSHVNTILTTAAADYKEAVEALSLAFSMTDAERLNAAARVVDKLAKDLVDLNSGQLFLNSLQAKYTQAAKDSARKAGDSIFIKRLVQDPIITGNLIYIPSIHAFYDISTGKSITTDPNFTPVSIPSVELMRQKFDLRGNPGNSATVSDYTQIFSASGVGLEAEIICSCFIAISIVFGFVSLMGVKITTGFTGSFGFEDNDNLHFMNKATTWFLSTLIFLFLFIALRFLF